MAEVFEVRRHAPRGQGKGLSAQGVELAKRASETLLGNYQALYTSPKQRCIETLQAFGFETYKVIPEFATLPSKLEEHQEKVDQLQERAGCSLLEAYLAIPATRLVLEEFGGSFFDRVCELADELRPGRNALAVSHGGSIEPAVLAAMPDWDLETMGGPLGECEAALFRFENKVFTGVDILRL
ncbi:MAG: histidine phosphatase family protein [Candidatus Brocadiia bacterium]